MKQMKIVKEFSNKISVSSMLGTSESSHTICKPCCGEGTGKSSEKKSNRNIRSPSIRVVHVYEPEIIMTDPENFKSLVQKLTGKSIEEREESCIEICEEKPKNLSLGGFSQGFNNFGMLFHRGSVIGIPLVKNTSPFCNIYEPNDGCRLAESELD